MRLLLAEDEKELSSALTAILRHNHYEVDAVYDGEQALNYLRMEDYDAAILDVMMPKMDGISVLKQIRAEQSEVPVLILTAKTEIDDKVEGLDSGADDYLGKPFSTKELLARLRAIVRRKSEGSSAVLHFADASLNTATFLLSGSKQSVRLPNKEYQILLMLFTHPNQILSTDQIFEKIWGYENEADTSVVWVTISYLRKKLAYVGAHVKITAMRGQGYLLKEEA